MISRAAANKGDWHIARPRTFQEGKSAFLTLEKSNEEEEEINHEPALADIVAGAAPEGGQLPDSNRETILLIGQNLFFLGRVEAQAEPLGYEVQWATTQSAFWEHHANCPPSRAGPSRYRCRGGA